MKKSILISFAVVVMFGCSDGKVGDGASQSSSDPGVYQQENVANSTSVVSPGKAEKQADPIDEYAQRGYLRIMYPDGTMSPDMSTPKKFDRSKMNIYDGAKSINFFSATVEEIQEFVGSSAVVSDGDGNGYTKEREFQADGIDIFYNFNSGGIAFVSISDSRFTLELGGSVGVTKEFLLEHYKGGYLYHNELNKKDIHDEYLYMLPETDDIANNKTFRGYVFVLHEGIVDRIWIGGQDFVSR